MRHLISILAILAFLSAGCSGGGGALLRQADAVMEEHPDSALDILMGIDRKELGTRDLPYYALLMTQAQVKTDVPLDSDSLISIAYRKYSGAWRGDRGIRSGFYMGEVFFNQDKPREAMRHYLTAYEESKRLGNDYWRAKSAERIADLFFNAYNYPEAAKYRKEAIDYYGKSERIVNQRYSVADLATDYLNDSRFDDAIMLLDSIYVITEMEDPYDSLLKEYIRRMRIGAMVTVGRTDELMDDDMKILEQSMSRNDSLDSRILKLQSDDTENNHKLNNDILNEILSSAKNSEDKVLALYACYRHLNTSKAMTFERELIDSLIFYQNAVAENIIQESALGAERDFYVNMALKEQQESRLHLCIIVFVILLGCIATIAFSIFTRLRYKAHKSELESKVQSILNLKAYSDKIVAEKAALNLEKSESSEILANLRQKVKVQESIINKLGEDANDNRKLIENMSKEKESTCQQLDILRNMMKQESDRHIQHIQDLQKEFNSKNESRSIIMESLFRNKWSTLNRLCEEYFEKGMLRKFQELLIKDIESEVRKIGSKEGLRQIEEEVDRYMDGIVLKLRTEATNLKENDIILSTLIFAGFSVKAICFILNITTNNFYVRKKRLIQKINNSNALNKKIFLDRL